MTVLSWFKLSFFFPFHSPYALANSPPELVSHRGKFSYFSTVKISFSPSFYPSALPLPYSLSAAVLLLQSLLHIILCFLARLISCTNKHTGPQKTSRKLLNMITEESDMPHI